MAWTYETITPTLIPNTTMEKMYLDGVHKLYKITPNEGYLLHDVNEDNPILDENWNSTGEYIIRFGAGSRTVRYDYDFTATTAGTYTYTDENGNEVSINVTKVGVNEYYTVPASIVPIDNQYGGGSDHEVM